MVTLDSLMFEVQIWITAWYTVCGFNIVDFPEKPEVMSELFATISKLVVRNEFCQAVMDMGGIHLILSAFQDSIANKVRDSSLSYNVYNESNRTILTKQLTSSGMWQSTSCIKTNY